MGIIKNILMAIGLAFVLSLYQQMVESNYILLFLKQNLLSLLVALLAINTASLGIVLSKIREIIDSTGESDVFLKTKKEMIFSVYEQIILIFLSLLLLMTYDSKWLLSVPKFINVVETSVISCFTYGMLILLDTAKSIFIILDFKVNKKQ